MAFAAVLLDWAFNQLNLSIAAMSFFECIAPLNATQKVFHFVTSPLNLGKVNFGKRGLTMLSCVEAV